MMEDRPMNRLARNIIVTIVATMAVGGVSVAEDAKGAWVTDVQAPWFFAVRVENVDRSANWYRNVLGLRELDGSEAEDKSWRILNLGNSDLSVELIRDDRATAVTRARTFAKVGFRVPDVEVVADRAEKETGERPRIVEFEEHGVYLLQLRDPDGNVIQLSSPVDPRE